jgi:hypothetical protein
MTGPVAMTRERKGAPALAWELVLPAEPGIPFLIEDRTPREQRVPGGAATAHPNGATGVAVVNVGAREPAALAMRLADLFEARLASVDGCSVATFAGVRWDLVQGERDGAIAVELAGVRSLPPELEALGVVGAR